MNFSGYVNQIVADPEESIFYSPFNKIPRTFSEEEKNGIVSDGKSAIMEGAVAGYEAISIFFEEEYYPSARTSIGASELPDGKEFYEQRVSYFTTTGQTIEEIHQTGLEEVSRIKAEMQQIINELKFKGDFNDFLTFLRTNPQFYAKTPLELIKEASYIAKKADAKMPSMFELLPRQSYGVAPVPDHLAPKYTGGRAVGAPISGTESGYYWVNTYNLPSRPLYTLEALTLHEAVPGHHLQGALSQELEGIHPFRQNLYISAYGEGWGLYCEYLGTEMGFYQDPYSAFGRLTYEMWRACRLVVDTGIHAYGWTRDEVVDYLAENTALSYHEIGTETDRYISWPGQALAYKTGELKIRELRKRAEDALIERFDVREFHNRLLSQGTVTLPILELIIDEYIAEKLK